MKFFDIGANLTDGMFLGRYHGRVSHEADLHRVLRRASVAGVTDIMVTAGQVKEIGEARKLIREYSSKLHTEQDSSSSSSSSSAAPPPRLPRLLTTAGIHPTRCSLFKDEKAGSKCIEQLATEINSHPTEICAVGELGIDYDRTQFCSIETQRVGFRRQCFELIPLLSRPMPLFLHCRGENAVIETLDVLRDMPVPFHGGVIHSFTGSVEEARAALDFSPRMFIGINGCSLKTEEQCQVVASLPLDRLMIETDAPWCGIKATHYSSQFVEPLAWAQKDKRRYDADCLVKGRAEPAHIVQVAQAIAHLLSVSVDVVAKVTTQNALAIFSPPAE